MIYWCRCCNNSASIVNCTILSCFLEHQRKSLIQYPNVLFMSSMDPAQSLSENPYSLKFSHFDLIPYLIVPLMCPMILFSAHKCISVAQFKDLDKSLATNRISSLVAVSYIKHLIKLLKFPSTILSVSSSLLNFSFGFIGVLVALQFPIWNFLSISPG